MYRKMILFLVSSLIVVSADASSPNQYVLAGPGNIPAYKNAASPQGITPYDDDCEAASAAWNQGNLYSWKAFVSTSTGRPESLLTEAVPIYGVDGVQLFPDATAFSISSSVPASAVKDFSGATPSYVLVTGNPGSNCDDWTDSSLQTVTGHNSGSPSSSWWGTFGTRACNNPALTYCLGSLKGPTTPEPTTPEPTTTPAPTTTEAPAEANFHVLSGEGFIELGWADGFFVAFTESNPGYQFTFSFAGDDVEIQNQNGDYLRCFRKGCLFGTGARSYSVDVIRSAAEGTYALLQFGTRYLSYANGKFALDDTKSGAAVFKLPPSN